ncbi:MAG: hypothetical protein IRZ10_12085 [Thermoflavifilum sp.]|nr:hypothetical protein [Thermoflavifilum sp.]MCL6515139.1 hypothetical protein [Alicyclobacillus sp.]
MQLKLFQVFYPQDYRNQRLPERLPLKVPNRRIRWHRFGQSNLFGVFIRGDADEYNEMLSCLDMRYCHTHRFSYRGLYHVLCAGVKAGWRLRDAIFDDRLDAHAQRMIRVVLQSAEALRTSVQRDFLLQQVGFSLRVFERDRVTRLQGVCLTKDGISLRVYRNGMLYVNKKAGLDEADALLVGAEPLDSPPASAVNGLT